MKTHVFDAVHMRFLISVFVESGCTKQTRKCVQVGGDIKSIWFRSRVMCENTCRFDGVHMRFLISGGGVGVGGV